jgi:hypothetical protein
MDKIVLLIIFMVCILVIFEIRERIEHGNENFFYLTNNQKFIDLNKTYTDNNNNKNRFSNLDISDVNPNRFSNTDILNKFPPNLKCDDTLNANVLSRSMGRVRQCNSLL